MWMPVCSRARALHARALTSARCRKASIRRVRVAPQHRAAAKVRSRARPFFSTICFVRVDVDALSASTDRSCKDNARRARCRSNRNSRRRRGARPHARCCRRCDDDHDDDDLGCCDSDVDVSREQCWRRQCADAATSASRDSASEQQRPRRQRRARHRNDTGAADGADVSSD